MNTRTATKADFKTGTKMQMNNGSEIRIQDQYGEGMWNARVFDGSRIVGEKVVYESEAEHYQVEIS